MDTKTFLENFGHIADAPNGVEKLRNLILELAVKGALVPQNPNDEPAQELLNKCANIKKRLVENGDIRPGDILPDAHDADVPFDIPESWQWAYLSDIAHFKIGKTPPRKESKYWSDDEYPWVSIRDMEHMALLTSTREFVSQEAFDKTFRGQISPAGTILMSFKLTIGKMSKLGIDAFHNEAIASIYPFIEEMDGYIYKCLPELIQYMESSNAIKGQTLNKDKITKILVTVPPLEEQKRIVAKVDQLMALCDQLETQQKQKAQTRVALNDAALDKLLTAKVLDEFNHHWQRIANNFHHLYDNLENLSKLRATIFQLAVQGQLVEQNRSDRSASSFVEKLIQEKQNLIEKSEIKKAKSTDSIKTENCNWHCPESWEQIELQDLFRFIDYRGKTPKKSEAGKRLITAKNIRMGYIQDGPIEYVSNEYYITWMARGFPKLGDILFVTEGHTMGFSALNNLKYEFALAQRTICLQPFFEIESRFFLYVFMSGQFQNIIVDNRTGSAAAGIKASKLKRVPVPMPPVEEQKRIVANVDQLMALCDQLESKLKQTHITSDKLVEASVTSLVAA